MSASDVLRQESASVGSRSVSAVAQLGDRAQHSAQYGFACELVVLNGADPRAEDSRNFCSVAVLLD